MDSRHFLTILLSCLYFTLNFNKLSTYLKDKIEYIVLVLYFESLNCF